MMRSRGALVCRAHFAKKGLGPGVMMSEANVFVKPIVIPDPKMISRAIHQYVFEARSLLENT
jgi:hypothetical protein